MQDLVYPLTSLGSTATGSATGVEGGLYNMDYVSSNWGTGVWQLQALLPDNATYVNVGNPFSANGVQGPIAISQAMRVRAQLASGTPSAAVIVRLGRYQDPK
jgi:hypothetical protein